MNSKKEELMKKYDIINKNVEKFCKIIRNEQHQKQCDTLFEMRENLKKQLDTL